MKDNKKELSGADPGLNYKIAKNEKEK